MSVNYRKLHKKKKKPQQWEDNYDKEVEEEDRKKIAFNLSHKLSCVANMIEGKCPHNSATLSVSHTLRKTSAILFLIFAH